MAGGLAGTALLMQGTARADTAVATSTSITGTTQLFVDPGIPPVLKVDVSVSAQSGSQSPTGNVQISTQTPDGTIYKCVASLTSGSNATSTGSCELRGLPFGSYNVHAGYQGSSTFSTSSSAAYAAAVGTAPSWTASSPSLSAQPRGYYDYTFAAKGVPAPTYSLQNAPIWLNVDQTSGHVFGWLPSTVRSFGYTVVASNAVGSVKATFTVSAGAQATRVVTWLNCPRSVYVGQGGSCTLNVKNTGSTVAHGVNAGIALPRALTARWCSLGWGWSWGRGPACKIHDNTATWQVGRMWPGQTKAFLVFFTARHLFWNDSPRATVIVTGAARWDVPNSDTQAVTRSYAKVTVYQHGWW